MNFKKNKFFLNGFLTINSIKSCRYILTLKLEYA